MQNQSFYWAETNTRLNTETGELLKEKKQSLHKTLPVVPYFEKSETQGKEETKKRKESRRMFSLS